MPKYEVFRIENSGADRPFTSLHSHYLLVEEGSYIFHDLNKKWSPNLVLPVRHFWVAKVD